MSTQVWELDVKAPGGSDKLQLHLQPGPPVSGHVEGASGITPLEKASLDGNELTYEVSLTSPLKARIRMNLTFDGDTVMGTAKPVSLPLPIKAKVSGRRLE